MKRLSAIYNVCALVIGVTGQTYAQTLDDVREQLREGLQNSQFAAVFAGLIVVSDELELSGARYEIDDGDDNLSNTELRVFSLPFRKRFDPWKEARTRIYVEGVLGYGKSSQSAGDIYFGMIPGLETSVDADWTTFGGLVGVGPEFKAMEGRLTIAPILNGGAAYIKSDADYGGPGAVASAAIFDRLAFNWDGWTSEGGGALRIDWVQPFWKVYELEMVGRYDIRWTQTFDTDSSAQDFSSRFQLLTLHSAVVGPTGVALWNRTLYWRALAGYRHFFEDSLFDVHDIVLLGAGLEYDITDVLPFRTRLAVKGGVILGEDISGYTVGLGLSF